MLLEDLQGRDPAAASQLLAAVALSTMPGATDEAHSAVLGADGLRLLRELRHRLRLPDGDNSSEARRLIHEALASSLHETVMRGKDPKQIFARLGQAGRLLPSQYKPVFMANFRTFTDLGIKRPHVEGAIARPDEFQHLSASPNFTDQLDFSVFLKLHRPANGLPYWLCVFSQRAGAMQLVQNAWRVYPSDVDISDAHTPLEVLRAFAHTYGCEMTIGKQHSCFISYERIPMAPSDIYVVTRRGTNDDEALFTTLSAKRSEDRTHLDVTVAYEIDLIKYAQALRRHKVDAKAEGSASASFPMAIL
jgi:hypothetical protein